MQLLRYLLLPLTYLYGLGTSFRNHLYDIEYSKGFSFEVFTIGVGNLAAGGTGKTPMIEYLVSLLQSSVPLATLSRGYGRRTKGFRIADASDTAETIGDEPLQFYNKFNPEVAVAVGEERALAIPSILLEKPHIKAILLDDVFQHRTVRPDINLLLTEYSRPFYKDRLLPAGRLREHKKGASRASAIIVTKCPEDLSAYTQHELKQKIQKYSGNGKPVFFSKIKYNEPETAWNKVVSWRKKVVLFTGIANANPLVEYVNNRWQLEDHVKFNDHHAYIGRDFDKIRTAWEKAGGGNAVLLTTEKDLMRLGSAEARSFFNSLPLFFIGIRMEFLDETQAKEFNRMIWEGYANRSANQNQIH